MQVPLLGEEDHQLLELVGALSVNDDNESEINEEDWDSDDDYEEYLNQQQQEYDDFIQQQIEAEEAERLEAEAYEAEMQQEQYDAEETERLEAEAYEAGKSALVMLCHMSAYVQYEVTTSLLLH